MSSKLSVPPKYGKRAQARINSVEIPRGKTKPLKPREAKFVEIYAGADGTITQTEAAIQAGYPKSYAQRISSELLNPDKYPQVVTAIKRRQLELNAKYGTSFERHMKDLQFIRDKAIEAGAWSAAVQAEYRRGQALGSIYVDRKEIRHGTIDSMSKEEVMKKLSALKQLYQASAVDVEATVIDAIEEEKKVDHTEEFLDEARDAVLSEDQEGDDEGENNPT